MTLLQSTVSHGFADQTVVEYLTVVPDAEGAIGALDYVDASA